MNIEEFELEFVKYFNEITAKFIHEQIKPQTEFIIKSEFKNFFNEMCHLYGAYIDNIIVNVIVDYSNITIELLNSNKPIYDINNKLIDYHKFDSTNDLYKSLFQKEFNAIS